MTRRNDGDRYTRGGRSVASPGLIIVLALAVALVVAIFIWSPWEGAEEPSGPFGDQQEEFQGPRTDFEREEISGEE